MTVSAFSTIWRHLARSEFTVEVEVVPRVSKGARVCVCTCVCANILGGTVELEEQDLALHLNRAAVD